MFRKSMMALGAVMFTGLSALASPVVAAIAEREPNPASNPQDLGRFVNNQSVRGVVHAPRDPSDHFKIRWTTRQTVTVRLKPDNGADLFVYRDNGDCRLGAGDTVLSSRNPGSQLETIILNDASPGCYFVKVAATRSEFTAYTLDLLKGAISPPPPPEDNPPPPDPCPPSVPNCIPK